MMDDTFNFNIEDVIKNDDINHHIYDKSQKENSYKYDVNHKCDVCGGNIDDPIECIDGNTLSCNNINHKEHLESYPIMISEEEYNRMQEIPKIYSKYLTLDSHVHKASIQSDCPICNDLSSLSDNTNIHSDIAGHIKLSRDPFYVSAGARKKK